MSPFMVARRMSEEFTLRKNGDVGILDLPGAHLSGLSDLNPLREQLSALASSEQPVRLLINFEKVRLVNSDAIEMFIQARKAIHGRGGRVILCAMNASIRETFRALNLEGTLFPIFDTETEAIAAF